MSGKAGAPAVESALDAIRSRLEALSEAENKVARYVLEDPTKTLHYNVAELARKSGASQAAVVRFCKRIGAQGFGDFKLRLARDVFQGRDERFLPDLDLESGAPAASIIRNIVGSTQRSLARLAETLDPRLVDRAVDAITGATLTALFGIGASGMVAYDFYQKLLRIGLPASCTADTHVQITAAASLRPGDVAFIVSYSGETAAMIEAAHQAGDRGVTVVSLTMDGPNTLRGLADLALLVPESERLYREGAMTSRTDQLAVVDILYSVIVSRNLDASIAAMSRTMAATHPGKG
ncbi:MAG TPA: MurR/RpiR family transcriptional regulator [Spirochaetia bacterium]